MRTNEHLKNGWEKIKKNSGKVFASTALILTLGACTPAENKPINEEINKTEQIIQSKRNKLKGKETSKNSIEDIKRDLIFHYEEYVKLAKYYKENEKSKDPLVIASNERTGIDALEHKVMYLKLVKKFNKEAHNKSFNKETEKISDTTIDPTDLDGIMNYILEYPTN